VRGIRNTYTELPIVTKDGREVWIGQNIQMVMKDGQVTGFQAVSRDITERKRAEAETQRQLAEKEILLREVHHRIKNNIASIGGLISLRLQAISSPAAVSVLQDALSRINSMRVLYDKLLLSQGSMNVSVENYIAGLVDLVVAVFPTNTRVTLDRHIADFHLDPKRMFPLGIIINELLTNIMKYAFSNRESGLIKISLARVDNHVTLTIQDDGNGLPDGFDIQESKGFGLMLVKMLSQQLAGSFSIENHTGTRCTIEFDT
jgi:two-component sensor histidine kinase